MLWNQNFLIPINQSAPNVLVFETWSWTRFFHDLKALKVFKSRLNLFHNLQAISEFWSEPTIVQTPLQLSLHSNAPVGIRLIWFVTKCYATISFLFLGTAVWDVTAIFWVDATKRQRFVTSSGNIENAMWADRADFGRIENFYNFSKGSYLWGFFSCFH